MLNNDNTQIKATTSGFSFPYIEETALLAGTYHIEIIRRDGISGNSGTYNIRTNCYVNSTEPNNDLENAQLLASAYTAIGNIDAGNTVDIYKYELEVPGVLKVNATFNNNYLYVKWLDSDGTVLKGDYSYNAYKDSIGLEAGTYYIKVERYSSSYNPTYTMRGEFIAAGNDEIEPNQERAKAQSLAFGQTVRGLISYQDSIDMYKYVLEEPGRLIIVVFPAEHTICLLNGMTILVRRLTT